MYFIGVTTGSSSINPVFPKWAEVLGLGDAELRGMDFVPHDEPGRYREAVEFIKREPLALGALVTTHKIDLLGACRDLFDELDPLSEQMGEVSSIYKRDGTLHGRTCDPYTSGHAMGAFIPPGYWKEHPDAGICVLGAGGSSVATSWHVLTQLAEGDRPAQLVITNRSPGRLEHMKAFHQTLATTIPVDYRHCPTPDRNDAVVSELASGSLVINATGLGKDGPGSPLTDEVRFPMNGLVWEFNYRGDLLFLDQAQAQRGANRLRIEDGWIYFIHGWSSVISDVFDVEIPSSGPLLETLSEVAGSVRG